MLQLQLCRLQLTKTVSKGTTQIRQYSYFRKGRLEAETNAVTCPHSRWLVPDENKVLQGPEPGLRPTHYTPLPEMKDWLPAHSPPKPPSINHRKHLPRRMPLTTGELTQGHAEACHFWSLGPSQSCRKRASDHFSYKRNTATVWGMFSKYTAVHSCSLVGFWHSAGDRSWVFTHAGQVFYYGAIAPALAPAFQHNITRTSWEESGNNELKTSHITCTFRNWLNNRYISASAHHSQTCLSWCCDFHRSGLDDQALQFRTEEKPSVSRQLCFNFF